LKQTALKAEERERAKLVKNFMLMLKGFKEAITENSVWNNEVIFFLYLLQLLLILFIP